MTYVMFPRRHAMSTRKVMWPRLVSAAVGALLVSGCVAGGEMCPHCNVPYGANFNGAAGGLTLTLKCMHSAPAVATAQQ